MFEQKRAYWRSLDNAAKLFSAASSPKDTRVFRFYCELKEEVKEEETTETTTEYVENTEVTQTQKKVCDIITNALNTYTSFCLYESISVLILCNI